MELKVNEYQLPENISFNFDELKQELTEKVSMYESLVYTDDQIKEAKADKANLNKLKKALNDERIRREKEYMIPFNNFKSKINEIIEIIDKPIEVIDKQVKDYEEKKKQEKLDEITSYFEEIEHPDWLHLAQIMDDKWLNASVSIKSVKDTISSQMEQIESDINTLANLPEFGFEATEVYKSTLNMNSAISEAQRMSQIAKAKAEAEARAKEEAEKVTPAVEPVSVAQNEPAPAPIEEPRKWIAFQANMTVAEALELKNFFNSRGIAFKSV